MKLNITAGEYMNEHYSSLLEDPCIPFNEALSKGEVVRPLFSDAFIRRRAEDLQVAEEEYREKMKPMLEFIREKDQYASLTLWFGTDAFCESNLAVLKELLEQIGYRGDVTVNRVDEYTYELLRTEHWEMNQPGGR